MLDMFITIVSSIIELWACKKVFDYTSKVKTSLINLYFLISTFIIISTFYTNVGADNRILICIFVMFVFYKLNYDVNIYKCLIVLFSYWAILVCINALSMIVIVSINNLSSMNILLNDNFYKYETIVLGNIVLIVLLYIYKFISNDLQVTKREIYMCIPIVANMISFFIFYKYILKLLDISSATKLDILIMVILLTFSNIALIYSLVKILKNNKKYIELTKLQEKINAENKYYSNIKKYYIKTKELNHDMKNHLICIKEMNKKNIDTSNYINNIEKKLDEYSTVFDTGNITLNIILSEKKELCIEKEIDFTININFSDCNFIKEEDTCSIFANALDNAIEACEKIKNDDKKIKLQGMIVNKFFVIKITNTKSNDILLKKNTFLTTKEDKEFHGLGIKSIKNSLEKYGGAISINFSENLFCLNMMIPIRKSQKDSNIAYENS